MRHPIRLELTRVGLLVKLANRYTSKGAHKILIYAHKMNNILLSYSMTTINFAET